MKFVSLIFILFFALGSFAQITIDPKIPANELKGIIYKNEYSVEYKLHTSGMALGFNRGKLINYYKTNFYHFDLGYLNTVKEKKGNFISTGLNLYNTYTYGKANFFFPLRAGKGTRIYLSEKESKRGVAVGYSIEGGLTLGILKPYYLLVKSVNNDNEASLVLAKYDEKNHDLFTDENLIFDKAPFFTGTSESKFIPGVHLNGAIHYGIKAYEKTVYAVETGIMIDAYIKKVPIMVETSGYKNNSIFINVFVNVHIGKRWN
jgi:hypothetical protein